MTVTNVRPHTRRNTRFGVRGYQRYVRGKLGRIVKMRKYKKTIPLQEQRMGRLMGRKRIQ